ncbi:MAG TPA: RagB/SusD family nutrient uptake outer membrane protein [Puia sp.]|jgi:hypothetical protein
MKTLFHYILCPALILTALSCHKVAVQITTELTPNVFPQTTPQFIQASGPVYAALRGNFALDYWFIQSLSSDEAILPARGGNWFDPGNGYNQIHLHTWTKDNGWANSVWASLSRVIGTANQSLSILATTIPDSVATKKANLAEITVTRDLAYFMMMDVYGSIPIDTTYGDYTPHANLPRTQVFSWIENDVKKALPYLSTSAGTLYYGRSNKYTAYALLAKMYLNAEYYTGTARYDDCVAACDSIINAGGGSLYALEPRSTYLQMFYPTNGPAMKEFIFAIPYDPTATLYPGTNGFMYRARYDLNRNLGMKYRYSGSTPGTNADPIVNLTTGGGLVNSQPSGPESTIASFFAYFNDPNDVRNGQWLSGLQYNADGTPLMVKTTKGGSQGYDATYTGADAGSTYVYQLNITPDVYYRTDPKSGANPAIFDLGNDEISWNMGVRNTKFYPDYTNASNRNQNNDVPVFRYSDILLMKAEAILRGATATQGATALSLINQLRAQRTSSPAWTNITLDSVYNERCRELTWETWHRNDMIRFGKYEDAWGFKTDADPNHRIFPIPSSALGLNPALKQNPGYN